MTVFSSSGCSSSESLLRIHNNSTSLCLTASFMILFSCWDKENSTQNQLNNTANAPEYNEIPRIQVRSVRVFLGRNSENRKE